MRHGHRLGLINDDSLTRLDQKENTIKHGLDFIQNESISPETINYLLQQKGTNEIIQKEKLLGIVRRPEIQLKELLSLLPDATHPFINYLSEIKSNKLKDEIIEQVEIEAKYEGYIKRQEQEIGKFERVEGMRIPEDFKYDKVKALSNEGKEKLSKVKPSSIGQASRISGVTSSDISVLMVYIGR